MTDDSGGIRDPQRLGRSKTPCMWAAAMLFVLLGAIATVDAGPNDPKPIPPAPLPAPPGKPIPPSPVPPPQPEPIPPAPIR